MTSRPLPSPPGWGDHVLTVTWSDPVRPTRMQVRCVRCGAAARVSRQRGVGPHRMMRTAMMVLQGANVESCQSNAALIEAREVMGL